MLVCRQPSRLRDIRSSLLSDLACVDDRLILPRADPLCRAAHVV